MKPIKTLSLFALLLPLSLSASADDSDVVKLKSASSFYYSGGGFAGRAITIQARVRNIGYTKNVYLHYSAGGAAWETVALDFSSHHGNYDLFTYSDSDSTWSGPIAFAIRYDVNGVTYWNNNDGANFYLGGGDDFIIEDEVALRFMDADGYRCAGYMGCTHATRLTGEIYVENLYYHKNVGVRCSADGVNWYDVPATYSGTVWPHVERWSFDDWDYANQPGPAYPVYTCAVFFDNFWDNNFTQDYQIQYQGIQELR